MPGTETAFTMAFGFAILGLIVAIPVTQVLRAWSEGTIDGLGAIGVVLVIFTLFAAVWQTAGTVAMLFFVALLLLICIAGPIWWTITNKREHADLRDGKIDKCREALERDPTNSSAHAFLGDALMEKKSFIAAVVQYEEAIRLAPNDRRWQTKLKNAQAALEEKQLKEARKAKMPLR